MLVMYTVYTIVRGVCYDLRGHSKEWDSDEGALSTVTGSKDPEQSPLARLVGGKGGLLWARKGLSLSSKHL